MKKHKLTRGALAKRADISPNIIYHFLKGKSNYLSQPTIERIAQCFNVPISEIIGENKFSAAISIAQDLRESPVPDYQPSPTALPSGTTILKVAAEVRSGGIWGESIFLDVSTEEYVSFSLSSLYAIKAFAVRISGPSMDKIFPEGAVLACVPVKDYLQRLLSGDIVIMVRQNQIGLFETTVKQYFIDGERHFLCPRSSDPRYQDCAELFSPLSNPLKTGHQDFFIHSIVLQFSAKLPASSRSL